ncbi:MULTISPECIES: leucyl aminopeptidase [Pontibacillus]|uniref:Probable cytosol aminopeptidase n=1 Tax=Pontibacillus chungwhensis TaxID=265426 RepID=A0ABY8UWM3_9BACI|nr:MULTISPECIES: leucyl aminopeptidase [Pontibacillus]MCD5325142.1 leucyl aminopeptidase [Pontibacillus sp. HN14]WIF97392.1 leucyl aminopeptidase [Pontibacillus chungwhensis]
MFTIQPTTALFTETDSLVFGLYHENKQHQPVYGQLNEALGGALDQYIQDGDLSNDYKKISKVFTLNQTTAKRIYVVGLGKKKELTSQKLKKAFGRLFKQLQADGQSESTFVLNSFQTDQISELAAAEALSEAMVMGPYQFDNYKTNNEKPVTQMDRVTVLSDQEQSELQKSLEKGSALGHGANTARHLVQLPGNLLTATDLAEYASSLAEDFGFEKEILEKEDMERLGMGALLAVNQGSTEPPKMIVLKYQGKETWDDVVGLVGKGITFDTGGYSIKSKDGIVGMKGDMGGAAAVLGAMEIVGRLKPKQNVVAVIPSTDNMISGSAFKPDDVITSLSGKTIEVLNTDAEGRLALADGITYAKHHKADRIIDVATLTGGVVVALGDWMTGAMTNNDELYAKVDAASKETDELIWQLPYNEIYKKRVRSSELADVNNSPGRKGHAIMAGSFLAEFAESTPWVHLDIAGTSQAEAAYDLGPKGPTGVMARTLATYIMNL